MGKEDPTCNTVYVAAVLPTGSGWQDILAETSEHPMQVKASRLDDIARSHNHYKSGYREVDTNSRDVYTLVTLPQSGKRPSNQ